MWPSGTVRRHRPCPEDRGRHDADRPRRHDREAIGRRGVDTRGDTDHPASVRRNLQVRDLPMARRCPAGKRGPCGGSRRGAAAPPLGRPGRPCGAGRLRPPGAAGAEFRSLPPEPQESTSVPTTGETEHRGRPVGVPLSRRCRRNPLSRQAGRSRSGEPGTGYRILRNARCPSPDRGGSHRVSPASRQSPVRRPTVG